MQKGLMLAVDVGHEVLRGLGQVQNGLQPDNFGAGGLHGRILPGQKPKIVQFFVGKNTLVVHFASSSQRENIIIMVYCTTFTLWVQVENTKFFRQNGTGSAFSYGHRPLCNDILYRYRAGPMV